MYRGYTRAVGYPQDDLTTVGPPTATLRLHPPPRQHKSKVTMAKPAMPAIIPPAIAPARLLSPPGPPELDVVDAGLLEEEV